MRGRPARVNANDIMPSIKVTHRRADVGLTKCPRTGIYWVCVFLPKEGWKAARVAREVDLRYVTIEGK